MQIKTSASLLSCNLDRIAEEISHCESAGVDMIHFDVMDGQFVEQISYGSPVLKSIRGITNIPIDTHLMVLNPDKQIRFFAEAGADIITIHAESDCNIPDTLEQIHILGKKAGIAISPKTPTSRALDFLSQVDMVLVMSVEPGYGGQAFIPDVLTKITEIRENADKTGFTDLDIEVDGGINRETAALAVKAGANVLAAGTFLFKAPDMKAENSALKGLLK